MPRLPLPPRVGRMPLTDVVLAGALAFLAVGGLLTGQVQEKPLAATVPIALMSTGLLALRRSSPVTVAGTVSVLAVAQALLTGHSSGTLWSLVVFLVMAYTVAAEREEGPALAGIAALIGSQLLCEWLDDGSDYAFVALVFGGVWLFGRATRSWRDQATYAERHRHDLARIAVVEERARIARELHDVVAHSLSVIAVQADAAEAALAKQPDRAAAPLRAIRDSAREALADMRQLLHVLRADQDDEGDGALAPARGLADLPQLVAGMRESGLPLRADLETSGTYSAGLELTAFRIAQEALTNVRKHAGDVPTHLLVARDDDALRIEVHNEAPSTTPEPDPLSTGHGLVGARERVDAAGGTFEAGCTPSGGFGVVARLPIEPGRSDR